MSARLLHPTQLDELLLYRLSRIQAQAAVVVTRLCEGRYGITRREWRLLVLLAQAPDIQPSTLAARAQLDRARTSRAISSLVNKGLLSRVHPPGDRRLAHLTLTPQGLAVYQALFPQIQALNQRLLQGLDATALSQLDALLCHLDQQAQALPLEHADLPPVPRGPGRGG